MNAFHDLGSENVTEPNKLPLEYRAQSQRDASTRTLISWTVTVDHQIVIRDAFFCMCPPQEGGCCLAQPCRGFHRASMPGWVFHVGSTGKGIEFKNWIIELYTYTTGVASIKLATVCQCCGIQRLQLNSNPHGNVMLVTACPRYGRRIGRG
jgi:hypothetical protein